MDFYFSQVLTEEQKGNHVGIGSSTYTFGGGVESGEHKEKLMKKSKNGTRDIWKTFLNRLNLFHHSL